MNEIPQELLDLWASRDRQVDTVIEERKQAGEIIFDEQESISLHSLDDYLVPDLRPILQTSPIPVTTPLPEISLFPMINVGMKKIRLSDFPATRQKQFFEFH